MINSKKNLLSANLGSDQIYTYRFFSNNGSLLRLTVTKTAKPGDRPRHMIFNSNQKFLYVLNERQSTITIYKYYSILQPIQTISTIPKNFTSINTGAEILLHPIFENYLYVSNRGHDSIAVFTVNKNYGYLTHLEYVHVQGRTPRNFKITSNGKYLIVANQDSNNLVVFSINQSTGQLTSTNSIVYVPKPTCISQYIY